MGEEQKTPKSSEQISIDAAELRHVVRNAIERRSHVLVYEIANRLFDIFRREEVGAGILAMEESTDWTSIESLSQLRAIVGGRFQNIKQKWVEAGFPLREHRGDRGERAQINDRGWTELALWINRQGFEARLASEPGHGIFEVRPDKSTFK